MLFLIRGDVIVRPYQGERRPPVDTIRIVDAEDKKEAIDKFVRHFEAKSIDQYEHYDVEISDVSEVIT